MQTQTSMKSQLALAYGGNPQNWLPSKPRSLISVSAGTYVTCMVHLLDKKRVKYLSTITEWEECMHNWTPKNCMESCSMPCLLVIPAGQAYLASLEAMLASFNMVFSFCTHPHGIPHSTSHGENNVSAAQASQDPSHHPATQLTIGHSLMPAWESELLSQLDPNCTHGDWPLGGSPRDETYSGLRQLASNCLSSAYAHHHMKENTLWPMGTTAALLKDGGKYLAPTNPPTRYSNTSSSYWKLTIGLYT